MKLICALYTHPQGSRFSPVLNDICKEFPASAFLGGASGCLEGFVAVLWVWSVPACVKRCRRRCEAQQILLRLERHERTEATGGRLF